MSREPIRAFHLRVERQGDGWSVSGGVPGESFATARLDEETVRRVRSAVDPVQRDPSGVMVARRDAERVGAEERAGRALAEVLVHGPVLRRFAAAMGASRVGGAPLLVGVDSADPEIRALPWELLADDTHGALLEPRGEAVVALLGTSTRELAPVRPGTTWWTSDPDDPVVVRVGERLRGVPIGDGLLVLAGHGERLGDSLILPGSGDALAPSTVDHVLRPHLVAADLVVLAVCDAVDAGVGDWASQLLATGAVAVIGPMGPVRVESAIALLDGVRGRADSVHQAIAAGRRSVRALAMPSITGRWWRWRATVGALRGWSCLASPSTWSGAAPDAAEILADAADAGAAYGYLGVEHLLLAWADARPLTQEVVRARAARAQVEALLTGLTVTTPGRPEPSPRLRLVLTRLPTGFTSAQLWQSLVDHAEPTFRRFLGAAPLPSSRGDAATAEPGGSLGTEAAVALEVVGGPEDGRRIEPRPGATLGRAVEPASGGLYDGTSCTDQALSRSHLRWVRAGYVEVSKPMLHPAGSVGGIEVAEGLVLALTPATWLRGVR